MNKRQKESLGVYYANEEEVLKELEKQYEGMLKDINKQILEYQGMNDVSGKMHRLEYQKRIKSQVEASLEMLHSNNYKTIDAFLNDTYTNGFVGTMYDLHGQGVPVIAPIDQRAVIKAVTLDTQLKEPLYESIGVDVQKLKKTISSEITRGISSGLLFDDIARNIKARTKAPLSRAKTIVRTEGHRIQEASTEDARQIAKSKGADVVKQWDATLDGQTRETHRLLDGQIRETDEPFEIGTKKAMYPGDFGDPAEDCNCRCCALTRARAALDADELKVMQERARYFGLQADDSKEFGREKGKTTFADFKKKYLRAADEESKTASKPAKPIVKSGESGIMEVENLVIPTGKFTDYALNPTKAPDKARAFFSALGYNQSNAGQLIQNILNNIDESKFVEKGDVGYGMLYQYVVRITGANGKEANVLTAWIEDGTKKRMTSVYVTEKKVTE